MERFETGVPRLCARVEVVWGSVYGCVGTSRSEFLNGFRSWYVAALASQGVILCFKGWAVFSHLVILASVLGLSSVVVPRMLKFLNPQPGHFWGMVSVFLGWGFGGSSRWLDVLWASSFFSRVGGRSYWFSGGMMIFGVMLLRPCVNFFLSEFRFFICFLNVFLLFL